MTSDMVRRLFDYSNGKLYWKFRPLEDFKTRNACGVWNSQNTGNEAGSTHTNYKGGPRCRIGIRVNGKTKLYLRSHLVWLMHNDSIPDGLVIDHINRISTDDRIENLRVATLSQNGANSSLNKNNTSGVKGVVWHKRSKRWHAIIRLNGKPKFIGQYKSISEAAKAYADTAKMHRGEYAHTG